MQWNNRMRVLCVSLLVASAGCAEIDPISQVFDPIRDSGRVDFAVLGVMGDGFCAGYQNGGLVEARQAEGFSALVARQLGKSVLTRNVDSPTSGQFVLPGYGATGSPGTLALVSLSPPTVLPLSPPGSPVNTQYPGVYNSLGVPGARVTDAINTISSPTNPFFDLVLRGQGTMVQQMIALEPTFVLFWLGPGDILCALTSGQTSCMTSVASFETDYRTALLATVGIPSVTGMVAANIPDVLSLPFATTVPPFVVDPATNQPVRNPATGALIPLMGPRGPLSLPSASSRGDLVTLPALGLLRQGIGIPEALGGTGAPLSDAVVIYEDELEAIQTRTQELNAVIARIAEDNAVPLVDAAAVMASSRAHGVPLGGLEFTPDFLEGGLVSLDGVFPWTAGHGVLANAFIARINSAYGASVPWVNYAEYLDVNWKSNLGASFNPFGAASALDVMFASPWTRAALNMD